MSGVKRHRSRMCFVPGCKTGYKSDRKHRKECGEPNTSLFQAPTDLEILEKWRRIIPRTDKILGPKDCVCALHFLEEDISRFYETKLPDGTIDQIERGKPKLKNGSVPSIFSNLARSKKRRKVPSKQNETLNIKQKKNDTLQDPITSTISIKIEITEHPLQETLDAAHVENEMILFENLKKCLSILCTPNKQWSGTFIPGKNEIMFAEWDDTYVPKKRIVIHQDMSFKVFFGTTEIKLDGEPKINGFDEIEKILESIDNMKICSGIKMISTPESCLGITPLRKPGSRGASLKTCIPCTTIFAKGRKENSIIKRHEEIQEVVEFPTQKKGRLKQKITTLRREIEDNKTDTIQQSLKC